MNIKHISIATVLIVLIIILSELHSSKTKQQLQDDLYKAEERHKNSKEKTFKRI